MTDTVARVKSLSYGALVWQQFRRSRLAIISLATIALLLVVGTFAPFLANDRPILVKPDPDRAAPIETHLGQETIVRTGWFSPVWENLTPADQAVLIIFGWAVLQILFRLLTVPSDNPTRRVFRVPRLARNIVTWTFTAAALVGIALAFGQRERLYDQETQWQQYVRDPSAHDVFWLAPISYRPYQGTLEERLQMPTWALPSKETYIESERKRLQSHHLATEDYESIMQSRESAWSHYPTQPRWYHWLGTDQMGRDTASQLIYGARISLVVGFVSVSIAITIGTFVGALGGFFGGKVDFWVMRFIEVMMCFPTIFLILTLSVVVKEKSVWSVMVIIGITGWTGAARLVRGEFFKQRGMEYVTAGHAIGGSPLRIMFRHILPNAMAPVLVAATFGVAGAIITESTLSFLNLGVPEDVASWGRTLSYGINYAKYAWWLILFPGLAIFVAVTSYNLAGEGLRDAVDPRLRT